MARMETYLLLISDDKEMAVENDIMGRFNNKDCPALKGKPKFFLLHTILDEQEEEEKGEKCTHTSLR